MRSRTTESLFLSFRAQRDARALGEVFDRTAPRLLRVARHLTCAGVDPRDLLQETFVKAIEAADAYDPDRPVEPWLLGILINQARLLRRQSRRNPDPALVGMEAPPRPEDAALEKELWTAVRTALRRLPPVYREVIDRRLTGEKAVDVAARLGRSPATVRKQLHRSIVLLRQWLPQGLLGALLTLSPARRALAAIRARVLEAAGGAAPSSASGLAVAVAAAGLLAMLVAGGAYLRLRSADHGVQRPRNAGPAPRIDDAAGVVVAGDSAAPAPPGQPIRLAEVSVPTGAEGIPEDLRRRFSGRVVDEKGKTVAGAVVEIAAGWNPLTAPPHLEGIWDNVIGRGTTGDDGCFSITVRGSSCLIDTGVLTARADGLAPGARRVPVSVRDCVVGDVVLDDLEPHAIRVLDSAGAPLPGVRVTAWHLADWDLAAFERAAPAPAATLLMARVLGFGPRRPLAETLTDSNGAGSLALPPRTQPSPLIRLTVAERLSIVVYPSQEGTPRTFTIPPVEDVSGHVTGPDGTPLSNVAVTIGERESSIARLPTAGASTSFAIGRTAYTDEQGRFTIRTFTGMPAHLGLRKTGFRGKVYELRGAPAADLRLQMETAPAIEVRVTSAESGEILPEARVEPVMEIVQAQVRARLLLVDADWIVMEPAAPGVFTVTLMDRLGVLEGKLLLRASCAGYAPSVVRCPDQAGATVTIELAAGGRVHGRVRLADASGPAAGVVVRAQEVTWGDSRIAATAVSDVHGAYVLTGLQEGTFRLGAFAEGFIPSLSSRVNLGLDEDAELDFELHPAAILEGRVVSRDPRLKGPYKIQARRVEDGERVGGFMEELGLAGLSPPEAATEIGMGSWGGYGPHIELPCWTDAEGRFALKNRQPGAVAVRILPLKEREQPASAREVAGPLGPGCWSWSGGGDSLAESTIQLESGKTEVVEFEVGEPQKDVARVSGRVVNTRQDLEYRVKWALGSSKSAVGRWYDRSRSAAPETDGSFDFPDVTPGSANVSVHAQLPGRPDTEFEVEVERVEVSSGTTQYVPIELTQHAFVHVEVRDNRDGALIRDAQFWVEPTDRVGRGGRSGLVVPDFGLVEGRYRVAAWSPRHAIEVRDIGITPGVASQELVFRLESIDPWQTRLNTRVVDAQGRPVSDATIMLDLPECPGSWLVQARTDMEGTLQQDFPVLPGRYQGRIHIARGSGSVEVELDLTSPRDRIVVSLPDLEPHPAFRVAVVDALSGEPVAGARITFSVTRPGAGSYSMTGLTANEEERVLPPGKTFIRVRAPGYASDKRTFDTKLGDPLREIRFELRRLPE
ncbi:MAG: sigma-70 family RNA polymerase sigma factor [Planctomycetes bacterium]|nr:sigma-70 family RNA polymerase sigma factor [Planctomycetota bacterium]